MTPEQNQVIQDLQRAGYAVIIWTPEELGETDPTWVEDMSISYASEYLIPNQEGQEPATDCSRSYGPHAQEQTA